MVWAVVFLLSAAALGALIWFARELVIAFSCRADEGRIVFAHVRDLLRDCAEWQRENNMFGEPSWAGPEKTVIRVSGYSGALSELKIGNRALKPGWGWSTRIAAALNRMAADKERAARLNTICDVMEDLERRKA